MTDRTQIMVLGMHRSGTSLVSHLLHSSGAYVGPAEQLLPANKDNAQGFWERHDTLRLNDRIMRKGNAAWDRVAAFDARWISRRAVRDYFLPEAQAIVDDMNGHDVWVMKDPRLSLLLPLWQLLVPQPICVIVYRNPSAVAVSLEKRDQFEPHFALSLWEYYTVQALRLSQELPRILLSYDQIVAETTSFPSALDQLAQLGVRGLKSPQDDKLESIVNPTLRHQAADTEHPQLSEDQKLLWRSLESRQAIEGTPRLSATAMQWLRKHDCAFYEKQDSAERMRYKRRQWGIKWRKKLGISRCK